MHRIGWDDRFFFAATPICAGRGTDLLHPILIRGALWIALLLATAPSFAEPTTQAAVQLAPIPAPGAVLLPADTFVDFVIVDHLGSKISRPGDTFAFKLVEPVRLGGRVIIAAGAVGRGEVVHAAKARAMGKAGELILVARFIDVEGVQLRLRGFNLGMRGDSNVGVAFGMAMAAAPLAFLVVGGNIDVPPGTRGHARTLQDTLLAVPAAQ